MHFQWDILLLETGALAVLAAPIWLGQQETPLPRVEAYHLSSLLYIIIVTGSHISVIGALAPLPDDAGKRFSEAHLRMPCLVVPHCHAHPLLLTGEKKGETVFTESILSQCLPTPLAWFAALQPDWLHKLSVVVSAAQYQKTIFAENA